MSEPGPYRPAVPAGLPSGTALPRPDRPRLLTGLVWAALSVVLVGAALLSLLEVTSETGWLGLATGVVLAAVPVFPVVAAFLWLDRYEAEPTSLLLFAFAWGAGIATLGALTLNTLSLRAIQAAGGDLTTTAVLVAPFVEETLKGLAVVAVLLVRRREFDGVLDGIVYAGMAGVGFAFIENVLYLGRALGESGGSGTVFVFVLRCVVSPFAHPLFTSATGIGIGVAVRTRRRWLRVVAPLVGWAVAVGLHGLWNASASSGLSGFLSAYVVVQLPIFCAFVLLAVLARRREGRLIARHLQVYASTGWLTPQEVGMLASLPARRDARGWARRTGGGRAHLAMRQFQELGSELAFLRERMSRGTAQPDARTQEYAILAAMSHQRGEFTPAWATLSRG